MGITQQIGASSLIKPGVIDNTAARPASPYEGQVIFQKDTDQLLVWNGTAWVIPNSPAQNPQGLELITTATCTSGGTTVNGVTTVGSTVSSVTITNAFSATYDNYLIQISSVFSNHGSRLYMRGNGSTGTTHAGVWFYTATGSSTINGATGGSSSYFDIGLVSNTGRTELLVDVFNPFAASIATRMTTRFSGHEYGGGGSGRDSNAASSTSFDLLPGTGTMTGGTIRVYGYRNS
jgi:hypothetical protein